MCTPQTTLQRPPPPNQNQWTGSHIGVCIHCDKPGHFTNQCPNVIAPSKPPTHVNTVSPADRQEQRKDKLSS
ncbi:hypothetical protein I7I48_02122 [Histoplasma ohiense]|nr:hypothetical protein I7I48_02122 [Histoplasma ohiense (nom. inval.)]